MSTLLARALEDAKLDLLLLGALADRMRQAERGDVVKVHVDVPHDDTRTFTKADLDDAHGFLRRIAIARLAGDRGPLRIDAESVGLQLAQVALGFGADEIIAPIQKAEKKVLLEVYGERDASADEKAVLREREICGLITAAGRVPRIVEHRNGEAIERDPDTHTHAVRKFRAPGREVKALAAEEAE